MRMRWFLVLALSCACLTLGACGKKGDPFTPDREKSDFPHRYPKPGSSSTSNPGPNPAPDQPDAPTMPPGTISPALPVPVGP